MEEGTPRIEVPVAKDDKPVEKKKKDELFGGKVIFIVLVILLAVFVGSERLQRVATQKKLTLALQEGQRLQAELGELNRLRADLETQLGQTKQEAEVLAESLAEEKRIQEATLTRLNLLEKRLGSIENAEQLLARMDELEKENSEVKARLERIREAKEALETRIAGRPSGRGVIDLAKVTIKKQKATGPRVLVVNHEFDFVVISVGEKDGAKIGDVFTVYRKDTFIAKVKVEEVQESMSAAAVLPEWRKHKIKVDDSIRVL